MKQKKIKSLFLALLMFVSYIIPPFAGLFEVNAQEEIATFAAVPEKYLYWGVSIETYVKYSGGRGELGTGSNLFVSSQNPVSGEPFGKTFSARVISDDTIPSEYRSTDARMITYNQWVAEGHPTIENKKNANPSWKGNNGLFNIGHNKYARGLPYTVSSGFVNSNSFNVTITVPSKSLMLDTDYNDNNGTSDGSDRTYKPVFITAVIKYPHKDFDPVSGKWTGDRDPNTGQILESNVRADLSMSQIQPISWRYDLFDNGISGEYGVRMDASRSISARPVDSYNYEMGLDGENSRSNRNNTLNMYGYLYPDEVNRQSSGSVRIYGDVEVVDDKGVKDTDTANTNISYSVYNEMPNANSKVTDKGTNQNNYLYAEREILIEDTSTDMENNIMDLSYILYDGSNQIGFWEFTKDTPTGSFRIKNQAKSDEHITSFNLNPATRTNTIVFKKAGNYRLEQQVGDIRNHDLVSQRFNNKTTNLNIRSKAAPPVAEFDYILAGKPTSYTYPNVPVNLLDKSTDANNDIVSWLWTKNDGSTVSSQNGATTVFASEGIYNTTLRVTDFLGMSSQITKPIEVLPPIPMAIVKTNDDESLLKLNRRIIFNAEESFAPPSDPIHWDKTTWNIVPIDGQDESSIKISNLLSNDKQKSVVFKEIGKYEITITLSNNFTEANPTHPRLDMRTETIVIDIVEDKLPVPKFEILGNAPNFKDNPVSTVAKVTNTSDSEDSDYLDIFPNTGLADPNNYFGRGNDAFEMEIRKDINEDGIYSDDEVYGTYTGRSVDIPVAFKEGEGSDYRATLKTKETFGQPTITDFVTDADRKENNLIKFFSINWIPDISFDIPVFAYPDDTINVNTTIKDEKPDNTDVVWTVEKQDTSGVYRNVLINSATDNSLNRYGGSIRFKESGFYKLKATITDEKGQVSSFEDDIRIYPFPTAIITDTVEYRFDNTDTPQTFKAKQNRTYEMQGNTSHINDIYGNGIHAIDRSKDYFEIIPMQGQDAGSIKVTDGIGNLFNLNSEDSSIFKATNKELDRQFLFKQSGQYRVRYQLTNVHGKKSPFVEQIITVHEDEIPVVTYEVMTKVFRDPEKGNIANTLAYNIHISSKDRDNISLERVRYRFDSNNNGNFADEVWKSAGTIDKTDDTNWRVEIPQTHVGQYEFEIYAEESYGQPTIDRYVDKNGIDKRTTTVIKATEVDNQPPLADFDMLRKQKVDILLAMGQTNPNNLVELNSKVENYIKSYLSANGGDLLDTSVQLIESSHLEVISSNPNEVLSTWRKWGNSANWVVDSSQNAISDPEYHCSQAGYRDTRIETRLKNFKLKFQMRGLDHSSYGDNMGVTFRMNDSNNYYALMWRKRGSCGSSYTTEAGRIVSLNQGSLDLVKVVNGTPTVVASRYVGEWNSGTWYNIEIDANNGHFVIKLSGIEVINYTDPSPILEGNIGVTAVSHAPSYWRNINIETIDSKSLDEVLKTATWRDNSERFVINLDDTNTSLGYNSSGVLNNDIHLKLISMLTNNNINYVGLGTNTNRTQSEKLIRDNNGNGKFLLNNSPNIDKALQDTGTYILDIVKKAPTKLTKYVLINEPFNYVINYSDYENDPQYNIHRWKYNHNELHFENNLGKITNHNQWSNGTANGGITEFTRTGEYIVEYLTKDNPVGNDDRFDNYRKWSSMPNGSMTIFVHRKPLAEARFTLNKSGANMTANFTSLAFDKDHESKIGKGIYKKEWHYKELGANDWIFGGNADTFSFSGQTTKDYLVKHRVQDIDGESGIGVWSDDNIMLVTSKPQPPVAAFEISPATYSIRTQMGITDTSYDPNGDTLVEYRWNLKKDNVVRLSRTLTNAAGVTAAQINTVRDAVKSTIDSMGHSAYGTWVLELQVRDNSGVWGDILATSDIVSRTINVIPNNLPPTALINPTNVFVDGRNALDLDNLSNTRNNFINWNLSVVDPDLDNKGFTYRWEIEHHHGSNGMLKDTSQISNNDQISTRIYTTQVPFNNQTFDSQNLRAGAYKVKLSVTDDPTFGVPQTTTVEDVMYIVPKVTGVPYVIGNTEIIVGDEVTLRVVTDEITTGITSEILGNTVELNKVSTSGSQHIWETKITVPDIPNSAMVDVNFTLRTDFGSKDIFGSEGQTTRIKTLREQIFVTALKLEDFRVVDLVNHSEYKGMYPLRKPDFLLNYIAGYYVTFRIDAKGDPDTVEADVYINGSVVDTVELKKIGSAGSIGMWEGKYFAPYNTSNGSVISFELEANKGASKYNYNSKESWNGDTLEVKTSLIKDAKINRTN